MNSFGKTAIGKVTAFDPVTKEGIIYIKDTKENVIIQDRANKKDPLIFTLLEGDEFKFRYAEAKDKKVYISHLLNDDDQTHIKEIVLIRYALKFNLIEVRVQDLVEKLGFIQKGTMEFLQKLKSKGSLDYRITGPGVFAIDIKSKDITVQNENKIHLSPIQQLYQKADSLSKHQYIEFQKAMDIDSLRLKFLEISWDEIVIILNKRHEINLNENNKNLNTTDNLKNSKTNKNTDELERDQNLFQFGIAETNKERDLRFEQLRKEKEAKELQLNNQRELNKLATGFFETNQEREKREKLEILIAKKKKEEEEREKELLNEKKKNFDETGIYETNKERTTRELSAETILVDPDEIDARNKRRQYSDQKKIFVKKLKIGDYLKAEIINITDNVYWVEVNGFKAMIPRKLVLSYQGEFKSGETISTEVVGIDYKRLHITLKPSAKKPAAKKPAAKKPAAKKPAAKQNSNKLELFFDNSSLLDKNKSSTKLFGDYVKSALKIYGAIETSLTFPANKKKIRLINSGIESGWLNEEGLMTVVVNDYNTTAELLFLINKYVQPKDRSNCYRKLPEAVPLFLEHELVRQHKKTLKKNFEIFLEYAHKTGKNPWKKFHDPEVITYLNKVQIAKIKY